MSEKLTKKEAKIEQHDPQRTTSMDSLPREIALAIVSRLPIQSLIRTKFVCRSWRSLAQDPLLPRLQFSHMAHHNPCLLLHHHNHLYSLHFSTTDDSTVEAVTRISVPMIPQFSVVGSCNGLLCLWDSQYQHEGYIYNPFTGDHLQLPKPKQFPTQQRVATGFGFNSVTKEYKVVRIVYYRIDEVEALDFPVIRRPPLQSEVEVLTLKIGMFTWKSKGRLPYQLAGEPSQVLVNERLHWLSHRSGHQSRIIIISFDMDDEQFRQIPNPSYRRFSINCTHLVSLRGCLCGIVRGCGLIDIWIMKEYGVQESWIKELTIGIHQLPRELDAYADQSISAPKFSSNFPGARVLCILKNGEILLVYRRTTLIYYDVKFQIFKELTIVGGLPDCFQTIVHIGSLNWIDTPIDL